jgi:hypothetical protein
MVHTKNLRRFAVVFLRRRSVVEHICYPKNRVDRLAIGIARQTDEGVYE